MAEKIQNELKNELDKLKVEKEKILNRARDEAVMEISSLTREIRDVSAELKKKKSQEQLGIAKNNLTRIRMRLRETASYEPDDKTVVAETGEINPGDIVWLADLEMEARVVALNNSTGQITAESGSVRFTVDSANVSRVRPVGTTIEKKYIGREKTPRSHVSIELDLRGKRADEVELELESYIDSAIGANLDFVRIIHGYGTGVVRQIVRDYLSRQKLVKSFRAGGNDEGGDGVTVAALK